MKVMSSLPEQTMDLSLEDFRLKRYFIFFIADIKTDEGEVAEEEEELEDAEDIREEVEGDSLDDAAAAVAEAFLLTSTSSFDWFFSGLRTFSRSSLFIGPTPEDLPTTVALVVVVVMAAGSSSQLRAVTRADLASVEWETADERELRAAAGMAVIRWRR